MPLLYSLIITCYWLVHLFSTIIVFQTKIDRLQGADAAALESKIQQYYGTTEGDDGDLVGGHV